MHDDEPRPRLESHGDYVLGVFLVPVAVPEEDRIYYQEVDLIAHAELLLSVSKTPPGEQPFDPKPAKEACRRDEAVGMFVYHLVDEIAERYLDLIDDLDDEIDELEDRSRSRSTPREIGARVSRPPPRPAARSAERSTPTRDAVHKIVDDRVELDEGGSSSRATSRSHSATRTTSSCARARDSTPRASCSPACATTSRRRSPSTRTR